MITINFYSDGAYIKGHDEHGRCYTVSYAIWACVEDCLLVNDDVWHYGSASDENWNSLGLSYIKINDGCQEHVTILKRFRENVAKFVKNNFGDIKITENLDGKINWDEALKDAKREQGILL